MDNQSVHGDAPRWAVSAVVVVARSDAHVATIMDAALQACGSTRIEHVRMPASITVYFENATAAESFSDWAMDWDLARLEEAWVADLAKDGLTPNDLFDAVNTQPWARND